MNNEKSVAKVEKNAEIVPEAPRHSKKANKSPVDAGKPCHCRQRHAIAKSAECRLCRKLRGVDCLYRTKQEQPEALTTEQRAELAAVIEAVGKRGTLDCFCTPLNAPWIFAAIESAIVEFEEMRDVSIILTLSMAFPASKVTPKHLRRAIIKKYHKFRGENPALLHMAASAAVFAMGCGDTQNVFEWIQCRAAKISAEIAG